MKILYFVNYFPPNTGAAANNSYNIVDYLLKFGHQSIILAPGDVSETLKLKYQLPVENLKKFEIIRSNSLIRFPFNLVFSHFQNLFKVLFKIIRKVHPDLIMSQYHTFHFAPVVGGICATKLRLPYIIRAHDIFIDLDTLPFFYKTYVRLNFPLIYNSIKKANVFYATTMEMKNYLQKINKFKHVDFKIHYNGVDTDLFFPKPEETLKKRFDCENLILYTGLLSKDVGLENLILALRNLLKINKNTHVLIIGEGPYKNEIVNYSKKHDFFEKIHLLTPIPHIKMPYYVNNCDIGIGRLSRSNLFKYIIPVKCLEYSACKIPFITSSISSDLLSNDDVGIEIKNVNNPDFIANKLIQLIEDKTLRDRLGNNGLKKIRDKYTWSDIMRKFIQEIEVLIT